VPCARLHARQVLWEWRLEGHADTVELLVSELVTNAVQASERLTQGIAPVQLWLSSDGKRVVIQVWDSSPQLPIHRDQDLAASGGRGLLLVENLSAEWGSYRLENSSGKVVWAVVA
jgi:anti-sigma regulatory factor (Ser/Thr protein kinase)